MNCSFNKINKGAWEGGLRTKGVIKTSKKNKPLISIITVVYNGELYIEKTIKSVLFQSYTNIEYIIIDGGSSDCTLDIIRKYEHAIDYWVSEKDNGIYDAMNKGLKIANGALIGMINSDDWYEKDALSKVSKLYNNDKVLIYGNMLTHFTSGATYLHDIEKPNSIEEVKISKIHPTVFISASLYNDIGFFDTNYSISADFDLIIRAYKSGAKIRKINSIIANFREGGISSNNAGSFEGLNIMRKHDFNSRTILKKRLSLVVIYFKNLLKEKAPILADYWRQLRRKVL